MPRYRGPHTVSSATPGNVCKDDSHYGGIIRSRQPAIACNSTDLSFKQALTPLHRLLEATTDAPSGRQGGVHQESPVARNKAACWQFAGRSRRSRYDDSPPGDRLEILIDFKIFHAVLSGNCNKFQQRLALSQPRLLLSLIDLSVSTFWQLTAPFVDPLARGARRTHCVWPTETTRKPGGFRRLLRFQLARYNSIFLRTYVPTEYTLS